jgi:hypothetical protein
MRGNLKAHAHAACPGLSLTGAKWGQRSRSPEHNSEDRINEMKSIPSSGTMMTSSCPSLHHFLTCASALTRTLASTMITSASLTPGVLREFSAPRFFAATGGRSFCWW